MAKKLDKKLLSGFLKEAQSHFAQIRESLERFQNDTQQPAALAEAVQPVKMLKGAAEMIGLSALQHMATYVEEIYTTLAAGQEGMGAAHVTWLQGTLDQLDRYLESLATNDGHAQAIVTDVVQSFRRLKGLPTDGDAAAVADALFDPAEDEQPAAEAFAATADHTTAPLPRRGTKRAKTATPQPAPARQAAAPPTDKGPLDALVAAIDGDVRQTYGQGAISAARPDQARGSQGDRYVLFTLAGSRYAVAVPHVLEIGRVPHVTPVPNVPPWVRGVMNLRGEILSVIDFRTFLGFEEVHQGEHNRMLVVKTNREEITTSLVVDQVVGIVQLPGKGVEVPAAPPGDKAAPYLSGVYEHEKKALAVFDLERFLLSTEVRQFD